MLRWILNRLWCWRTRCRTSDTLRAIPTSMNPDDQMMLMERLMYSRNECPVCHSFFCQNSPRRRATLILVEVFDHD